MTKLTVEKVLNTKEKFMLNGSLYNLIVVNADDSTKYTCHCVDSTNGAKITTVPIASVPSSFNQYVYRITNADVFERDNVIYAYKKTTKVVNEINAIIGACTESGISFMFRDVTGEVKTQMLTPKQISDENITIMMYDKPTV